MKALACTLGAILMAVTWSAPAAALDITFDDVMSVGNPLVTMLETAGYRFTAASFRTIDTPGGTFVANDSAVYVAQEAGRPGGITMTRIDGGPFFLYEFDAGRAPRHPAGRLAERPAGEFARAPGGRRVLERVV